MKPVLNENLGKTGEDIVCRYLEEKGYTILDRNFREKHLEIDILALRNKALIFVEVKTRKFSLGTDPDPNFSKTKISRLRRVIHYYLERRNWNGAVQCDLIQVGFQGNIPQIQHIEEVIDLV